MLLYHGSHNSNITELKPISKCNECENLKVVYLTDNKAYSLFYIWDELHNNRKIKWVTCWIENNIVHYEEQFSNQLFKFYNKVSGYVYSKDLQKNITKASGPSMWYTTNEVFNLNKEKISNVYEEILRFEKMGEVIIHRYDELTNEARIKVDKKMCDYILFKNLLNENTDDAIFMKRNHKNAWKMAVEINKKQNEL